MWSFEQVAGHFDIIYCSNVLEHFETYRQIAQGLLSHCKQLYVLVPYREMRDGKPLALKAGQEHVVTFDKHSFDFLRQNHCAKRIRYWLHPCPGVWGPTQEQDL